MSQTSSDEHVILLHGLARSSHSMKKMAKALEKAGYSTINVNYPSRKYTIEQLADNAILKALSACPNNVKIHFVTHSMGGILVRQFLSKNMIDNLGHVVMLGPPNKGSQLVDKLGNMLAFKLINGPAGRQLGTDQQSLPICLIV